MTGPKRFLDAVSHALDRTLERPADNEAEPVAILWPDESRQWEPLVLQLGESRPILTLGDYDAQSWTGPAYWLRCVIDGALPGPPARGFPSCTYLASAGPMSGPWRRRLQRSSPWQNSNTAASYSPSSAAATGHWPPFCKPRTRAEGWVWPWVR